MVKKGETCLYHFLVNRVAGNGRGELAWNQIQPVLEARKVPYRVSFPSDVEESLEHVHSLHPDVATLVVIGGDGTIQSVLAEVMARGLNLGVIPAGSGNDVARGLHIPLDAVKALSYLLSGTPLDTDVIRLGDRYFMTAIGVGFDGAIAFAANESNYKRWLNRLRLGRLTYVFALMQVLFRFQPTEITLTLDGTTLTLPDVWLVATANFPSYGGGMHICPSARWNDGVFDVCVAHRVSRLELLRMFPKVYSGKHVGHPAIRMFSAKHVKIESRHELLAHGDGELAGTTPLEITFHAAQVKFISASPATHDSQTRAPSGEVVPRSVSGPDSTARS